MSNGSNSMNISARASKGQGKVTEIKYTGNLKLFKLFLKILGRQDRRATAGTELFSVNSIYPCQGVIGAPLSPISYRYLKDANLFCPFL